MQSAASWILLLPLLGFAFNAFSGFFIKDKPLQKRLVSYIGPGVVLGAFVLALSVMGQMMNAPGHRLYVGLIPGMPVDQPWMSFGSFRVNFTLLLDPLSMLMALIVTGVGGLIHVYATGYMADDPEQPRFFTYFNLFIFMMLLLVMGENFLMMFVGWEGVGSCSYLLISFWYTDVNNAKAGNKAFIVNRVGDVGFTLGILAIWSVFGTLSFYTPTGTGAMDLAKLGQDVLHHPLSQLPNIGPFTFVTAMCILLFIGAMGKSAQIPLWVWLPDAMAGPTPVSALIHAATMVTAGVVMLSRCSYLFVQAAPALQLVGWIGLATAFVGATVGLVQTDIKRVLAFSTVSQLGYMFLACGVGNFTAAMFHVTTHAFFKALLFLGAGAVIHSMQGEQDMRKMGGLRHKIVTTWAVMFIGTYAIAGFPLLSGFWSKDEILDSASRSPWGSGPILYFVGLATAFMTAFYMNRLMWKTFYTEPRFVDGRLEAHHHSNFSDEDDAHGHGDTHDVHHNPQGEQTGHEEAGHAANTAHNVDAGHGHGRGTGSVHTSPPSMMWPLYILAVPSLLFGLFAGPWFGNRFEDFLSPSVWSYAKPGNLKMLEEGHELFSGNLTGYVISSIIAIAGIFLAYFLYRSHTMTGSLIPEERKEGWLRATDRPLSVLTNPAALLYDTFTAKWGFDAFYNFVFIKGGGWFAENVLWKLVDRGIIDGVVNGFAGAVGLFSKGTRRLQTGYVRNYALAMLLGVVVIIGGLLYTYQQQVNR
jgi:NADH-quinone oxidoreductase subunit L